MHMPKCTQKQSTINITIRGYKHEVTGNHKQKSSYRNKRHSVELLTPAHSPDWQTGCTFSGSWRDCCASGIGAQDWESIQSSTEADQELEQQRGGTHEHLCAAQKADPVSHNAIQ